jgi:hypothetical protein
MNLKQLTIFLGAALSLNTGMASQDEVEISQQEYEASIASFGVSQTDSESASKKAVEIARELQQQDPDDPMDSLPTDWLESKPY